MAAHLPSVQNCSLGTYLSSLTPKADPILDGKAMNLNLISVYPLQ